jgi:hypothetical protein
MYANEFQDISECSMKFEISDLRNLFDQQISRLFELIDKQITAFPSKCPAEQIAHIVLTGGLGNNEYVQRRLNERYAYGASRFACARDVKVSVAPDPQLTVCKGMIIDRVRKLNSGKAVLGWRCCRASYGTTCKILYNRNNPEHLLQTPSRDFLDGKDYIHNGVAWFIRKVCHCRLFGYCMHF